MKPSYGTREKLKDQSGDRNKQLSAEKSAMNRGNIAMVPIESLLRQLGRATVASVAKADIAYIA